VDHRADLSLIFALKIAHPAVIAFLTHAVDEDFRVIRVSVCALPNANADRLRGFEFLQYPIRPNMLGTIDTICAE
jgi:hypothetical protein